MYIFILTDYRVVVSLSLDHRTTIYIYILQFFYIYRINLSTLYFFFYLSCIEYYPSFFLSQCWTALKIEPIIYCWLVYKIWLWLWSFRKVTNKDNFMYMGLHNSTSGTNIIITKTAHTKRRMIAYWKEFIPPGPMVTATNSYEDCTR